MIGLARVALCGTLLLPAPSGSPAGASGKVEERELGGRRAWIYTPPGYDAAAKTPYDLLIAFDGAEYVQDIELPRILDALFAERKAPPFVAVMIDNGSGAQRIGDLGNRESFAAFLSGNLLPYVREHW